MHGAHGTDDVLVRALPGADGLLTPEFGYTEADVAYAVSHEMARSAEDILQRRTRIGFLDQALAERLAPTVQGLLRQADAH